MVIFRIKMNFLALEREMLEAGDQEGLAQLTRREWRTELGQGEGLF